MIRIEKLSYAYPQKNLYNEVSFSIEDGQHCAFIGTSGSGKSTLINMIMDREAFLYDGKIEIDPACRIGYVRQFYEMDKSCELTVFDYIAGDYSKVQNEITNLCNEMATSSDLETLMEQYQDALDRLEALGGDDFESNIEKKLFLADLTHIRDIEITSLSGGEFKLIQIIKEMLNGPELIIMDEPDVFLDFENLNSLRNLINSHKGMLLVITHNRYILNNCFNKIIHLENAELQEFDGRYIDYNLSLLQLKIELQEQSIADDEEIARNEALVERLRFIATHNAEAARGKSLKARVKYQERLEARRTKAPFVEIKQPAISFVAHEPNEEDTSVLNVNGYNIAFDDTLLENVEFEVKAGDKVALVGPNGTGKTTLLRDLVKNDNSSIAFHPDVSVAYLSQHQGETLDESNTVNEEFVEAGFTSYREIRSYLRTYGFDTEMLDQKIGSLSGGEKNILQLAKISASKANFLLLDEPTSHLDTYAQIALENAIEKYDGTVFMISHDFYSIVNCMDYILYIDEKTIRKVSMRKFRKMIYKSHFEKDYLEVDQKKKEVELKVARALQKTDFELAKKWSDKLETIIKAV